MSAWSALLQSPPNSPTLITVCIPLSPLRSHSSGTPDRLQRKRPHILVATHHQRPWDPYRDGVNDSHTRKHDSFRQWQHDLTNLHRYRGWPIAVWSQQQSMQTNQWIVDSGASHSVCSNRLTFEGIDTSRRIVLYCGAYIRTKGHGIGTVDVCVSDETGQEHRLRRHDVIFCPNFRVNLISVKREIQEYGSTIHFSPQSGASTITLASSSIKIPFMEDGQLYILPFAIRPRLHHGAGPSCYALGTKSADRFRSSYKIPSTGTHGKIGSQHLSMHACEERANIFAIRKEDKWSPAMLLHLRMAHISMKICAHVHEHSQGLPKVDISRKEEAAPLWTLYTACGLSQVNRLTSHKLLCERPAKAFGDIISADLHGPIRVPSFEDHYRYCMLFHDHASGLTGV